MIFTISRLRSGSKTDARRASASRRREGAAMMGVGVGLTEPVAGGQTVGERGTEVGETWRKEGTMIHQEVMGKVCEPFDRMRWK